MLRRDCRHILRYGGRYCCRLVWVTDVCAEPAWLDLGCDQDERCVDYTPLQYKRELLTQEQKEELEADDGQQRRQD